MNDIEQAKQHLNRASALYENHRDFQQALDECEAALQLDPYLAEAHNLRGVLLEALDKPLKAVGAYRKALKIDPDFIEANENLEALKAKYSGADPLVTLAVVETLGQAYPLKARLEEDGIKVFIPDEELFIAGHLEPDEIPEIHLVINKSEAKAALKILENEPELLEDEPQFLDDDGEPLLVEEEMFVDDPDPIDAPMGSMAPMETAVTCPWCGSYKVGQTFPFPFIPRQWKCRDCRHVWDKQRY